MGQLYFFSSFLFLSLLLLCGEEGQTLRVHKGPSSGNSVRKLTGQTVYQPEDGSPWKLVTFTTDLKTDAVLWDELKEDGLTVESCSRNTRRRTASIVLTGDRIDVEDYNIGTSFVMGAADWERLCNARVRPVRGVDRSDDALFYRITRRSFQRAQKKITLRLAIISGRAVAPSVLFDVEPLPSPTTLPAPVIFDDQYQLRTVSTRTPADTLSLQQNSQRRLLDHLQNVTITAGVSIEIDAKVDAGIERFRLARLRRLEFRWEQFVSVEISATIEAIVSAENGVSRELTRKPIPKLGFSLRIPFVGRVSAGVFVKLDAVADLRVSARFRTTVSTSLNRRQLVTARLRSPRFNARPIPSRAENGQGGISLDSAVVGFRLTGFGGIRPAIGVGVTLGRRGVEGNIGLSVGLELDGRFRSNGFRPKSVDAPITTGPCDSCHQIEANIEILAKDLSAQLIRGGEVRNEVILVDEIFRFPIAEVCALRCRTRGINPNCIACENDAQCPSGRTCNAFCICVEEKQLGETCDECSICATGECLVGENRVCGIPTTLPCPSDVSRCRRITNGPRDRIAPLFGSIQ